MEKKKSTDELLKELDYIKPGVYDQYHRQNAGSFKHMKLDRALMSLIEQKGISRASAIKQSGIAPSYGYQILDGRKANPERDKVIMMCIGIGATFVETQNLMKVTGYNPLHVSNERDHFLAFAIKNKLPIIDINVELQNLNLAILE